MASGAVVLSKWVNALKGTALAGEELVMRFDTVVPVAPPAPTPDWRAFSGALRTPDEGVSRAEAVSAFDPAEADDRDEKEDAPPVPVAPNDAPALMYIFCSFFGSS